MSFQIIYWKKYQVEGAIWDYHNLYLSKLIFRRAIGLSVITDTFSEKQILTHHSKNKNKPFFPMKRK